jgi:hypothetical protein
LERRLSTRSLVRARLEGALSLEGAAAGSDLLLDTSAAGLSARLGAWYARLECERAATASALPLPLDPGAAAAPALTSIPATKAAVISIFDAAFMAHLPCLVPGFSKTKDSQGAALFT